MVETVAREVNTNGDGQINLSDAVSALNHRFGGGGVRSLSEEERPIRLVRKNHVSARFHTTARGSAAVSSGDAGRAVAGGKGMP